MFKQFLDEMKRTLPPEGRIMMCQFRGDPAKERPCMWRAAVLNHVEQVDEGANVYLCVSAMKRNERGEFRRRKENFAGGLLLMVDDLGTGPGSKWPLSKVAALPPTALVETSPNNFQAVYFFEELVTDIELFERLIHAFLEAKFLGRDPGMNGVNRVFRPPVGVNGKPSYGGWRVRLAEWSPERRFTVPGLAAAFGLDLAPPKRRRRRAGRNREAGEQAWRDVVAALREAGLLKRDQPDLGGWIPIRCPWTDGHTNKADNGAAIREPAEENNWTGAFKCHHGHCEGRGWRELTDYLAEEHEWVLRAVNDYWAAQP